MSRAKRREVPHFWEEGFPKDKLMGRLIHCDESDTKKLGEIPIYTTAAVLVDLDRHTRLINEGMEIVLGMLPSRKRGRFEFKARLMFADYKKFGNASKYGMAMEELLELMKRLQLPIRSAAVNRAGFLKVTGHSDPKQYAFFRTAEKVEEWFVDRERDKWGLFVVDPGHADDDLRTIVDYVRRHGLPNLKIPVFNHLSDTFALANSKHSVGGQMADFANFFLRMHLLKDEVAEPYFQIIQPFYGKPEQYERVWFGN